jgi:hypothetical protein
MRGIMKNRFFSLTGCALVATGLCAMPAMADIGFDGTLVGTGMSYSSTTFFGTGPQETGFGTVSIDVFTFEVLTAGTITFDMLSFGIYDSWIDPQINLFASDGDPLTGANFIAANDDSVLDTNGSVEVWDSYMEVVLGVGEYKIAVGSYFTTIADVTAGFSTDSYLFNPLGDTPTSDGRYHLDILGDVSGSMFVVPLPPAALAGLGLLGCLGTYRRIRN